MEYITGVGVALLVVAFAALVGLDRDRAFYPTVLIVIASYYVLFAAMGGSVQAALAEVTGMMVFLLLAVAGFKLNPWWTVLGLFAHGLFDFSHGLIIDNPGMPAWWPAFCGSIDVVAAALLGLMLRRGAGQSAQLGVTA